MAAQLDPAPPERVALLGRDDQVRAQLRLALSEAGADIVHEGDPREADAGALRELGAGTLIVNLDAGLEDAIDHLDALFDDAAVQVVFNESEVTQKLSGWDLSRWARHLVAKVLRHGDVTPPMPPGAESLPLRDLQPSPQVRQRTPEPEQSAFDDIADEARLSEEVVPASRLPLETHDELPDEPVLVELERDSDQPEPEYELAAVSIEKPLPQTASSEYLGADEVLEIDDFELVPHDELPGAPRKLGPDEPTVVLSRDELHQQLAVDAEAQSDSDLLSPRRGNDDPTVVLDRAEIEAGLDALEKEPERIDVAPASAAYVEAGADESDELDLSGIDDLLEFDPDSAGTKLPSEEDEEVDLSLDEDVAALAAQLDALSADPDAGADLDIGFDLPELAGDDALSDDGLAFEDESAAEPGPAPVPPDTLADEAPSAAKPVTAASAFGELSLLDLDAEIAPASAAAKPAATPAFDSPGLSLAPLDGEAVEVGHEGDATIKRVVVLGASIGGPDALRSFLGAIPAGFPALFVLVQHLENGFFARLAQQLQKASPLAVRVAGESDEPIEMGQVLVLPSDGRYRVRRDGTLEREDYAEPPRYKPCIDDAFRAVADEFGADTLAIIFSGMAGDAVDGASHVTAMGGEVWGQDPASCVVSSMIDGARSRGLLEVTASPRELGERLVARFGQG